MHDDAVRLVRHVGARVGDVTEEGGPDLLRRAELLVVHGESGAVSTHYLHLHVADRVVKAKPQEVRSERKHDLSFGAKLEDEQLPGPGERSPLHVESDPTPAGPERGRPQKVSARRYAPCRGAIEGLLPEESRRKHLESFRAAVRSGLAGNGRASSLRCREAPRRLRLSEREEAGPYRFEVQRRRAAGCHRIQARAAPPRQPLDSARNLPLCDGQSAGGDLSRRRRAVRAGWNANALAEPEKDGPGNSRPEPHAASGARDPRSARRLLPGMLPRGTAGVLRRAGRGRPCSPS